MKLFWFEMIETIFEKINNTAMLKPFMLLYIHKNKTDGLNLKDIVSKFIQTDIKKNWLFGTILVSIFLTLMPFFFFFFSFFVGIISLIVMTMIDLELYKTGNFHPNTHSLII